MKSLGTAHTKHKLCLDFANLKHACPKGIYVAPVPDEPLLWAGVLFVRKGPYANAILRFHIAFPPAYPDLPPVVTILNDVFHPLVTPLTTYSYSTRDTGAETVSASDSDRLPPGGLSLSHGFPEWFGGAREGGGENKEDVKIAEHSEQQHHHPTGIGAESVPAHDKKQPPPFTLEILLYLRVVFSTEALLDAIPLEAAANTGAWHAWRSYRSRSIGAAAVGRSFSPSATSPSRAGDTPSGRSLSPRQQPGGARRPGEWNWQGVWEDRVRKSVQASISEHALFGGEGGDVVSFSKMDADAVGEIMPVVRESLAV